MDRRMRALLGLALVCAGPLALPGARPLGVDGWHSGQAGRVAAPAHTDTPVAPSPTEGTGTATGVPPSATPTDAVGTATATPVATETALPTASPAASATPEPASATPEPSATPGPTDTAPPTASPTPAGTALPPVEAGLLVMPESQYAGGVVTAWGANYGCGTAGVELAWLGQTRLAVTRADPFRLVLTLPASAAPGPYEVQARCLGATEPGARAVVQLRAAPPPPVAGFLGPAALTVGQVAAFQDASTAGVIRRDWDFGDGSRAGHGLAPGHVFAVPGTYTVTLAVWDGAGRTSVATQPVVVRDASALARYGIQSDGHTVAFLDQSQGPFTWVRWEFGDGDASDRRSASHVYRQPGTYLPRLVTGFPGPGGVPVVRTAELGPLIIGDASAYNLAIVGLEVVQVNLADQALAAGRRTVARVHVRREGPDDIATARYDVRLLAYRADGTRLGGAPFLRRLRAEPEVPPARRDVVELELPREWTLARPRTVVDPLAGDLDVSEPITLSVEVRPLNLREDNATDNRLARPVTFQATGALELLALPVAAPDRRYDVAALVGDLRRVLPVSGTDLRLWLPLGADALAVPPDQDTGAGAALAASAQAWRSGGALQPSPYAVALAPAEAGAPVGPCAMAVTDGGLGLWVAATAGADAAGRQATVTSLVHALTHRLGLANAPGGVSDGPPDPDYPLPDGTLDGDGFDVADLSLRDRAEHFDYLSHQACLSGRPWWSAYGHGRLIRRLAAGASSGLALGTVGAPPLVTTALAPGMADAPPPMASDYAAVAGIVHPPGHAGPRVTMAPVFHDAERRAPADDGPGTGDWSITLLDGDGRTLASRRFDVALPSDSAGAPLPGAFHQVLPWHAFTRQVVLREGAAIRWSAAVPDAGPAVTLLAPAPGDQWVQGRAYPVRWAAQDPAGRPLTYRVDLSADDGLTWRPLGGDMDATELAVNTVYLPGCGACRVRVRAANGVLMGEAVSEPFGIGASAPVVAIMAPADGATVIANEPLWLEGAAYDPADGPLGAGRVAWLSNQDGNLGLDPTLQTVLSVGTHTVRFSAINSAGRTGRAQITLHVVPARRDHVVWLPWVGAE